jgi:hypothetical protein
MLKVKFILITKYYLLSWQVKLAGAVVTMVMAAVAAVIAAVIAAAMAARVIVVLVWAIQQGAHLI